MILAALPAGLLAATTTSSDGSATATATAMRAEIGRRIRSASDETLRGILAMLDNAEARKEAVA